MKLSLLDTTEVSLEHFINNIFNVRHELFVWKLYLMFEFQSTTEADGGYWGEATAVTNRQMSSSTVNINSCYKKLNH